MFRRHGMHASGKATVRIHCLDNLWKIDPYEWLEMYVIRDSVTVAGPTEADRENGRVWFFDEWDFIDLHESTQFLENLKIREGETVWLRIRWKVTAKKIYCPDTGSAEFCTDMIVERASFIGRSGPERPRYINKTERAKMRMEADATLAGWLL